MFQSIILCTVSLVVTVLPKFAVVFARFHTFNFSCVARWLTKQLRLFWLKSKFMCLKTNQSW